MLREDKDAEGQEELDDYLAGDSTRPDDPEAKRLHMAAMGGEVD
jgi:hypothetical protein